jgi:hypothetical protein
MGRDWEFKGWGHERLNLDKDRPPEMGSENDILSIDVP